MKNEIEDSDLEFWMDFEKDHIFTQEISASHTSQIENPWIRKFQSPEEQNKKKPVESLNWTKAYYQEKTNRIRESQEPKINNTNIITRNHVKREYNIKLQELKDKYESDFKTLINDVFFLKRIIISRDKVINFMTELLSEINLYYIAKRIKAQKLIKPSPDTEKDLEKIALLEEVSSLRSQIMAYKELYFVLQDETNKANKLVEIKENEKIQQQLQYQEEINKMNETFNNKINEFIMERTEKKIE